VGVLLALGDGLQGQELYRKELLDGSLLIGIGDRVSLSAGSYGGHENRDPGGWLAQGKVRLGAPFGPRSSTALYAGLSGVSRQDGSAQDESLHTLDAALLSEMLLTPLGSSVRFSAYGGPRFVHESYDDHLLPRQSWSGWVPGALGGFHLNASVFHLFAEGTVAWRPHTLREGIRYDGGPIFLPTAGVVVHLGSPFAWGGRDGGDGC
jgi:hypothetical protein